MIDLYQCPLLKAHLVYYFNNKLTYEEQKLLKEAMVELVRNEKLLAFLERQKAKRAASEEKRLEQERKKRKKRKSAGTSIKVSV